MTWARGQPGVWNPFVSKGGEDPEGWQLRRSAGQNAVFTVRGSGAAADPAGDSGGSGADGAWHLYVGTFNANTGERALYVDGILRNYQTGNNLYTVSTGARLVLGGRSLAPNADITGTANFTGGSLYDVRIYNVALTGAQQASLFTPSALPAQKITATPGGPGEMILSWVKGGNLLEATNITGPWTTNLLATPPYVVQTTNTPGVFYRVLLQ
jgi:hypothetical protein